jgi:hypothetical protein
MLFMLGLRERSSHFRAAFIQRLSKARSLKAEKGKCTTYEPTNHKSVHYRAFAYKQHTKGIIKFFAQRDKYLK